jgi:predicted DNA-binding transcriptional regulator YafY
MMREKEQIVSTTTDEKLDRLIEMMMEVYPDTLGTREIAEALDITQQSARNYIAKLHDRGVPVQEPEEWRFHINPADYARPLRLTQAQAWFVYMLVRRVVRSDLNRYASVNSVLVRLLSSLYGSIAEQIDLGMRTTRTQWDEILTVLVEGWQKTRLVRLRYLALNASTPTTFTVAPWSFEPAVWTDSHYLVAGMVTRHAINPLMLKLDRIQSAELLSDRFERPPLDDLVQRINGAWGIWEGVGEAVTLRFSFRVKTRVLETRWHPTQTLENQGDGALLWRATVSEPRELMPWVRSWGTDVEVLSPDWLRAEIAADALRTARLYGMVGDEESYF